VRISPSSRDLTMVSKTDEKINPNTDGGREPDNREHASAPSSVMKSHTLQTMRHCRICDKQTVHIYDEHNCNHLLHFFLSVATSGFWLLIWFIIAMCAHRTTPVCTICGGVVPKEVKARIRAQKREAEEWKRIAQEQERKRIEQEQERKRIAKLLALEAEERRSIAFFDRLDGFNSKN
jgi:hypothetical protein